MAQSLSSFVEIGSLVLYLEWSCSLGEKKSMNRARIASGMKMETLEWDEFQLLKQRWMINNRREQMHYGSVFTRGQLIPYPIQKRKKKRLLQFSSTCIGRSSTGRACKGDLIWHQETTSNSCSFFTSVGDRESQIGWAGLDPADKGSSSRASSSPRSAPPPCLGLSPRRCPRRLLSARAGPRRSTPTCGTRAFRVLF